MNTKYNLMYLIKIGITINIYQALEEDDYTPKEKIKWKKHPSAQ